MGNGALSQEGEGTTSDAGSGRGRVFLRLLLIGAILPMRAGPPVPATSVMRFDLDAGVLVESVVRADLSREVMGMSVGGWSTIETRWIR